MTRDLASFFSPQSIAIIGASRTPGKVGSIVLANIINSGFKGKIFPVNPQADSIEGYTCYPDVSNLPQTPDLAIIALPAGFVIESLKQIGEKGIKNVVVLSAGFKEIGPEGEKLEKELIDISNLHRMNVLGPNCMGFVNNNCPVNTTFGQSTDQVGNIRFITQSGAIASSIFDWCKSLGFGLSEFMTLGNKAVLNENDVLEYFATQSSTNIPQGDRKGLSDVNPIGMYLESIINGEEFLRIAGRISKKDPIFILKPGKTQAAAKAMQSHTGSIAGEDAVLDAALSQAGVIRCQTMEDFFDLARAFAWENAPLGSKVAIISNAGGPAVITSDAVVSEGLELVELNEQIKTELEKVLPRAAGILNPIDIMGDALADRYAAAAEIVLKNTQADALVVILTPQVMTQIGKTAELIGELSKKYKTPIFCSFIGGQLVAEGEQKLNEYKIPSFRFPERAISAIAAMRRWKTYQEKVVMPENEITVEINRNKITETIENARKNNVHALVNLEANDIIQAAGITAPPTSQVADLIEAIHFAQKHGWPVVLKLSCADLLHKTEFGAVAVDIFNEEQLRLAWDKMDQIITHELTPEIRQNVQVQIQTQIIAGIEVILGMKRDPTFGPVILFGAGGIFTELIADRNLHLLSMDNSQIKELVERSKIYKVLKGYRGKPPYALDKLYDLIARFAKLAECMPDAMEIDLNPVIVTLNDAFAVDVKIVLKTEEKKPVAASPKFKVATTLSHEVLAPYYHYVIFETEEPLTYAPGQYISVKVADTRINPYSLINQEDKNKFGLLINTAHGGPGSKFFENVKVGEKISFLGPFGIFTLRMDDASKHLLFLGTGSGIAPLRTMLETTLKDTSNKPATLYFGLRYPQDIFWKEYFEKLEKEYPNFNCKLVLSKPDENWQGLTGHITQQVAKDFENVSEYSAYLCGSKVMIEEAKEILSSKSIPQERIYSEHFF